MLLRRLCTNQTAHQVLHGRQNGLATRASKYKGLRKDTSLDIVVVAIVVVAVVVVAAVVVGRLVCVLVHGGKKQRCVMRDWYNALQIWVALERAGRFRNVIYGHLGCPKQDKYNTTSKSMCRTVQLVEARALVFSAQDSDTVN